MNARAEADLHVLHQSLAATGFNVVTQIFPGKIIELQQIIDDASIPCAVTERSEKKRKLTEHTFLAKSQPEGSLAYSRLDLMGLKSIEAYSIVKTESNAMVQLTDQALAWFLLSHRQLPSTKFYAVATDTLISSKRNDLSKAPKSGQDTLALREELLSELHRAQEAGINIHASITKAHIARADLCSKVVEYPEIKDYVLALQAHDEHQALLLRQNIRDLRNVYIALYDLTRRILT